MPGSLIGAVWDSVILGGPDAAALQRGLRQLLRPEVLSAPDLG
jgi:hypothetical protein